MPVPTDYHALILNRIGVRNPVISGPSMHFSLHDQHWIYTCADGGDTLSHLKLRDDKDRAPNKSPLEKIQEFALARGDLRGMVDLVRLHSPEPEETLKGPGKGNPAPPKSKGPR
jgi:hypothetical protein